MQNDSQAIYSKVDELMRRKIQKALAFFYIESTD
jgi:hypothetical protein